MVRAGTGDADGLDWGFERWIVFSRHLEKEGTENYTGQRVGKASDQQTFSGARDKWYLPF